MIKSLKILEDTIVDIEEEIRVNPHPFLISTLERLKLYRDQEMDRMIVKKKTQKIGIRKKQEIKDGFRGFGIP